MVHDKNIMDDIAIINTFQSFIVLCLYVLALLFLSPFMIVNKLTGGSND